MTTVIEKLKEYGYQTCEHLFAVYNEQEFRDIEGHAEALEAVAEAAHAVFDAPSIEAFLVAGVDTKPLDDMAVALDRLRELEDE